MKKYWLYVVALLLPLFALAQAPPQFTTAIGRTPCGGNITVNWNADASILRDYWAILLKNNREQARQTFDPTQKKAAFTGLSNGAYQVKVQKKTGQVGYGGTSNRISITGTYNGFQVDTSQTAATEVAAGGECGASGKITIKIKNGVGPFVLRAYEVGQTTPAVTSAVTNKSGNETSVELSGLKSSTTYQIEVTDRVGNAGCSRTEPKSNLSYTTRAAAGSFLATDPQIEVCQPAAPGITPEGSLTVRLDNANGTGSFTVQLVNKDTNEVIITRPVTKGAGAITTARLAPDSGKKIEANKTYKVIVKDNGANCTATRQLGPIVKTYRPENLLAHLAPSCSSADCRTFNMIIGGYIVKDNIESQIYPGKYTVTVQPISGSPWTRTFTNQQALPENRSPGTGAKIYGNNEVRYWITTSPKLFSLSETVSSGDIVTIKYEDCSGSADISQTFTVGQPVLPTSRIEAKPLAGTCSVKVSIATNFQHGYTLGNVYLSYAALCKTEGIQSRIGAGSGGSYTYTAGGAATGLFRYFDQIDLNLDKLETTSVASNYVVEYAIQGASFGGVNNCRYYKSQTFLRSSLPSTGLERIPIGSGYTMLLNAPNTGGVIAIGANLYEQSGVAGYITDTNHLHVTVTPIMGTPSNVTVNATGPWNLQGTYTITFPKTFEFYPSMNRGQNVLYHITDIPPGNYSVTLRDNCGTRTIPHVVVGNVPATHVLNMEKTVGCVSGVSKGKVKFSASYTPPNRNASFARMHVFKYAENASLKLHEHVGDRVDSKDLTYIPNPDPNKDIKEGEIGGLDPGKYILGIEVDDFYFWYSVIDNPNENGYLYGYEVSRRNRKKLGDTMIYKEFTIEEYNEVDPTVSIGMCDPSDPNTGFVRVELPDGSEPQYPITYTLYKVSGGNKTVAVDANGTAIAPVTIPTKPANLSDAFATFNNVPKLTGSDTYEVKFESGCLDREVRVPDFGSLVAPTVSSDLTEACWNNPMTLSVDLSETVYNIEWKSEPSSALDGVSLADKKHSTLTFLPQEGAKYFVTYTLKTGMGCATPVSRNTDKKEIPLKVTNFTDASISSLPDISETMGLNQCATTATWTAPTITDTSGCGYRLTWKVVKGDGTPLYEPTPDASGNTPATTWNGFPVGESYVEYTVKGKADGGTVGKKRFKVTVLAPHVNVKVESAFVASSTSSSPAITTVNKGSTIFYKVTLTNQTTQALGGGTVKITLPNNTNGNYELPAVTDPGILTTGLGTSVNVEYDTNNPRVLILSNISGGGTLSQGRKAEAYIPIKIKDNADCSLYENACQATLTAKASFEYSTGNSCPASGTIDGDGVSAEINNQGSRCMRMELFCGSPINLTARGTGYTSYKWYDGGATGASYSAMSSTTATQQVTAAGYYKVEKIATCDGIATTTTEYIRVVAQSDTTVDPIREQAGNIGGTCSNTGDPARDGRWVSHFLLCANNSYTLRANFYQSGVAWQKANGCDPTQDKPNCYNDADSCWTTVSTDYTFVANSAGRYRLKVGSGACVKTYFFEVKATGLSVALEGQVTEHSALGLGAANLVMSTEGLLYRYTVKRVSDGAVLATNVVPAVDPRGSQYIKVPNLAVPNNLTSDRFEITVTPRSGLTGCEAKITVTIPKTDAMTARVQFTNEWSQTQCNQSLYKFTIVGGRRNYRYLIYKINGEYAKRSYDGVLLDVIPDSEYSAPVAPSNALNDPPDKFDAWIEVPREGRYIFLVKDQDDRVALTNEVLVGQTSKFAVEVQATALTCASQPAGKITAKFLDPTVPNPKIQLFKYKTDGTEDTSFPTKTNATGEFNNLAAGKYRVELSYEHSRVGNIRCVVKRDVEVTSPEPIEASIGVVKDNSCTNNGKFLLRVNWVRGGRPGYSFMSTSGANGYVTTREFYVDGGSEANPKIKVYVKDGNGCIAEFEVMAKKALVKPTLTATPVTYDCGGNGSFTVTPTTPTGKTYTYEYSLDGGARQTPNAGDGIRYTGLTGKAAPYVVRAFYKEPSTHPINELYNATFGDLERLDDSDGAPVGIGSAKATGVLVAGTHVLTKQLPSSATYRSEAGTGRYYAIHAAPGNMQLYVKDIENVVKLRTMTVKFRYINLGKNHLAASSVPLKVTLEVENPSGGGATRFSKTLPAATQSEGWKEGEVTFDELIGFNQKDKVRLIIESMVNNAVVGLDNIKATQPTETCQVGESISVQVVPNRGFSATITQVEPPKCHGGNGKIYVKLSNPKAGSTYTYQLSGGAFRTTPLVGTDKLEIEAPIGVHTLNIRMIDTDGSYCQVSTSDRATVVDIPQMEIEDLTINPKGCVAPYLTAGATVKVINGNGSYTLQAKKPSDPDFVDITTAADWTGNVGEGKGLVDNMTYRFRVKDANGCLTPEVSYYVPAKIEVTATANGTLCLAPSGTGTIMVEALTGNGGYEFELDGSNNWLSDPANPTQYEFDGLAPRANAYKIQVRDRLGCKLPAPIEITISDALEVGHTSDNQFKCAQNAQEFIEIAVKGGTKISGGYTVEWKRGGQASDPTGYNPMSDNDGGNVVFGTPNVGAVTKYGVTIKTQGVYHFRVTDARGCEQITSEEVVAEIPSFIASPGLSGSEINCAGSSDGVIGVFNGSVYLPIETAIDRTKGVAPYTIKIYESDASGTKGNALAAAKWNGQGLAKGYYLVELSDAKDCKAYQLVEVTEKPAPTLNVSDKKDVRCETLVSKLGEVRLTFSTTLSSNYRLGLYRKDNGGNLIGLAQMHPNSGAKAAKEDFTNSTSGTFLFENLLEGDYYPAVVNLSTGCMVEGAKIRIDGTSLKVKRVSQTVINCNTNRVKFEFREDGAAIDETQLRLAIYDAGLAHGAQQWVPTASYQTSGTGNNKKVTVEIDLQAGIDYSVVANYRGCITIVKPENHPVFTAPITENRKPNLCGTELRLDYTVTGLTGVTSIDWELYPYPLNIANSPLAGRITGGSAGVTAGKADILQTITSGVQEGKRYVLLVKNNALPNCVIGSKNFMVNKSPQPLAMVDVELIKNASCNATAQVRIKVKEGTPPYRYTITTSSADPRTSWGEAEIVTTNSPELVLDKTIQTSDKKIKVIPPASGQQTWYVHVRDANDCHVSQQVDIKEDKTPHIDSVEIENLCVPGTEYTVLVKLSQVGRGLHYYTIKPAGGVESAKQPLPIVEESPGVYVGRIFRAYADASAREIKVYDQNVCPSDNTAQLLFTGKPAFNLSVSKPITCQSGSAGNGEIKITNITNVTIPAHSYVYRLLREVTGSDVVVVNDTSLGSTADFTIPVSEAGKYRLEIVDVKYPDCPFSRTVTVREKVLPILLLQTYADSKCFNPTAELGEVDGGGMATFLASPETQLPMKYTVKEARYADDNTVITLAAASLTHYTNVTASNAKVTIDPSGRKVTFKGLYGHVRGVIYTIEVEGANGCKATAEVKIYGVKEITADMTQSQATQFKCSADQELVAKLELPVTAVTGGSGVYRFTLLKGGTPVTGNIDLLEPKFSIDDEAGGAYTLQVADAQYSCSPKTFAFPADRAIDPFVKVTQVTATEVKDITCNAGEDIAVSATLSPVPTKDVRISLSLRNVADGSHQSQIITAGSGTATVSHTFTGVPMGNYSVVATNEETGCVVYGDTYKVQDPNTFSLTATLEKPVKCYGDNTGQITFTLADLDLENSGGVDQATQGFVVDITGITDPAYTQRVTAPTGQATVDFSTLPYGAYTAVATSTRTGCVTKIPANFTIRQADQPIAVTAKLKVPDDCSATGSGEISIEVVGGVVPYKITMTGDNGHSQVAQEVYNRWLFTGIPGANAPGAKFDFRIEDAWGCDQTFQQVVKDVVKPSPIDYDPPVIPMVSCKGVEDAYLKIENTRGGAYDDPTAAQPKTTYYYELYHSERGAIRPLQTSNEFFNLPAGNYTLVVRDRWNCTKEQQFTIANPPEVKVTKTDASALVCYGDTGHVKVNVTGGTPTVPKGSPSGTPAELIYSLELVEADTDVVVKTYPDVRTSMLPYTINGLTPGVNYRVRASDGKQCPGASDLFSLTAAPNLTVKAAYEDTCSDNAYDGNVVITFDDATVDYAKMRYSFDGGTTRHAFATGSGQGAQVRINRSHASVKPSSLPQTIKLYYSDASTTCEGETNPVVIPVVEKLSLIKDPSTVPGLNELRLLGKNGVPDYVFYFNGVHKGNESTYIVRVQDPEGVDPSDNKLKKRIEAKVEDSKGCTAQEVFYVDYVDIEIPRFFTPNGDGENDTWSPRNIQQYPNILTQIYDRYGRLLKELTNRDTWDGTYNGKALPTGDYWYIITLGEENDQREFKGHFTLFR